jgi:hypothetical protein
MTRTAYDLKKRFEAWCCVREEADGAVETYEHHTRKSATVLFYTLVAQFIAGFQYITVSLAVRASSNASLYLTYNPAVVDDYTYRTTLVFAAVQAVSALIELVAVRAALRRWLLRGDTFELAYCCWRDQPFLAMFSMLSSMPMFSSYLLLAHTRVVS